MSRIAPCLWFRGNAEEAARFYVSLFPNSSVSGISYYGENMPMPAGSPMLIEFTLDGRRFQALNGDVDFPFTEAVSMSANCADQAEVDRLWEALTADGGKPIQCGWLKDRYGLCWQIVPEAVIRLQTQGDPAGIQRMMEALMTMIKLDVAALEAAYAGEG